MSEENPRFHKPRVRAAFDRAAQRYDHNAVLQHEVSRRLLEKLDVVKLSPEYILDAGCGTGSAVPGLSTRYRGANVIALDISPNMLLQCRVQGGRSGGSLATSLSRSAPGPQCVCADIEQLPFADDSFDLVFSSLSLQWCNDLDTVFNEVFRVLRPGGLYVFASFGPDTLKELRHSWRQVDAQVHVNQFIDMHDVGDALLRDGFAEPVMEAEVITMTYADVTAIMKDLKAIGASIKQTSPAQQQGRRQPAGGAGIGGRRRLRYLAEHYEAFRKDGVLPVSYEIVYGHAWKSVDDRAQKVRFSPSV